MGRMSAGCANGPSSKAATSEGPRGVPLRYVEGQNEARTPLAAPFRILHRLVVFGINDVQPGWTAGSQQLFIRAHDRQSERLQLQG